MLLAPRPETLLGATFPGGRIRLASWENYLLTDCTTADPLPDGLAHPVALFHLPILGSGIDIATLFAWCEAEGPGSVGLDGYDWEYHQPLRVDTDYDVTGSIVQWERRADEFGAPYDAMAFRIELTDAATGGEVARVTNSWRFRRSLPGGQGAPRKLPVVVADAETEPVGESLPAYVVDSVDAQRMKTMAALLRDPYRVHWDRDATRAMGLGGRVINQGPLNLSYIMNALHQHGGPGCIRRLTVAFHRPVFDGDRVVAGGSAVSTDGVTTTWNVWLRRDEPVQNELLVTGTAVTASYPRPGE